MQPQDQRLLWFRRSRFVQAGKVCAMKWPAFASAWSASSSMPANPTKTCGTSGVTSNVTGTPCGPGCEPGRVVEEDFVAANLDQ